MPGVLDPLREPLGLAVGSCYSRKDTPVQGRGSGTPTGHQATLTLLRDGPCTLRMWRSPISSDGPWGGEQPPGVPAWACTSLRPPRDPLCLGSVDPGLAPLWAGWQPSEPLGQCYPYTSGSFLGPSRQCRGKSSQRKPCGGCGNHPRFPDGVRRLGCGLVSKAVDAFKASGRARFQNPRWKLQSGFLSGTSDSQNRPRQYPHPRPPRLAAGWLCPPGVPVGVSIPGRWHFSLENSLPVGLPSWNPVKFTLSPAVRPGC